MWKKDTYFAGEPIPKNMLRDVKKGPTFYEHEVMFQTPMAKSKALDPEIDDVIGTVSVINNSWFNFFSFFLIAMIPIIPLALTRWGRFLGAFYAGIIEGLLGLLFAMTGNAFYVALVQGMAEEATLKILNNHYLLAILWQGIEWGQLCDGMNTILLNKAWAPGHLERMWIERGAKVGAMGYAPPIDISEHFNLINQFRKLSPFVKPSDLAPSPYSSILLKALVNYDYVVISSLDRRNFTPPEFSWPGPFNPYYVYKYKIAGGFLSKDYNFVDYIVAGMKDYISKGDYKYSNPPDIRWRYIVYDSDAPPLCVDGAMRKEKNYSMTNMPLYDSLTLMGKETLLIPAKERSKSKLNKYVLKPVAIYTMYRESVAPLVFPSVKPYKFEPKTKIDVDKHSKIIYSVPRPLFEAGHLVVEAVRVRNNKPSRPHRYIIPVAGCISIRGQSESCRLEAFKPRYITKGSVLTTKLSPDDYVFISGVGVMFECDMVIKYKKVRGSFRILIGDCITDFLHEFSTGYPEETFELEIDPASRDYYDITIKGTFRHSNSAFDFSYGFWRNYINGLGVNRIDSVPKKIIRDVTETHRKLFEKLRIIILKAAGITALALLLPVLAISGSLFFYQRPWWVDWVLRLYIDEKMLEEADILVKTISPILQDYANWTMIYYPNFVKWLLTDKHAPAIPSPTSPFALAIGSPTGEYAVRDPFKAIRGLTLADVITYFLLDLADFAQSLNLPRGLGLAAMLSAADEIGKHIDYYMPPATPGLKVGGAIVRENLKALMIAVEKAFESLLNKTLNDIPEQLFIELCVYTYIPLPGIETDGTYVLWTELIKALRAHIITAECKLTARWLKIVMGNVSSLLRKMTIYLQPHRFPVKIKPRTLYNVIAATSDHPIEVFWHMRGMQLARTLSLNVQYLRAWSRGETLD